MFASLGRCGAFRILKLQTVNWLRWRLESGVGSHTAAKRELCDRYRIAESSEVAVRGFGPEVFAATSRARFATTFSSGAQIRFLLQPLEPNHREGLGRPNSTATQASSRTCQPIRPTGASERTSTIKPASDSAPKQTFKGSR